MSYLLDVEDIRALLPHRYPFLMVDRILEIVPGKRIVGLKNVTINEPFFNGHFPGLAVMPGVLILEAMAQVAGLMLLAEPEHAGKIAYIGGIESARFRKPVVPGDTLRIEATLLKIRGTIGKIKLVAYVGNDLTSDCIMTFSLKDRTSNEDPISKLERIHQTIADSAGGGDNLA